MRKNGRYVVDLPQLMAECEANYARIVRLFPQLDDEDFRSIGVTGPTGAQAHVVFEVLERFKYTTSLSVSLDSGLHLGDSRWLPTPALEVRLYHDARVAEVMAQRGAKPMRGVYEYPNGQMYQADEKKQLNLFLAEWLGYCLSHGHSADPIELGASA